MKYRVRMTHRAMTQLVEAALWWAEHRSADEAARWLDGFDLLISRLDTDPERYPLIAEENRLHAQLRQVNYGLKTKKTHRAVFEVRDDEVVIHAIRHLSQDELSIDDISN